MERDWAGRLWLLLMPGLFVVLWSTGFIGAKLGLPYVEPFTFLAVRVALAAVLLLLVALLTRAPWPDAGTAGHIVVAGLLVHGVYLGGVFYAIELGLAAGVAAIIVALQPLLTAALAGVFLGERIRGRQWLGLILGLLGVGMVVQSRLAFGGNAAALSCALAALVGITLGTLYQKRYCPNVDLRSAGTLQYAGNAVVLFLAAALVETMHIEWSGEFIFALAWLVLVLSVGAVGLLFALIRRGAAAQVASLFYLAPPFAALFGYWLFDERLGPQALLGLVVVVVGVALVNWRVAAAKTRF